ncbi:MAG: glycosyltransferase family protein [Archangium sp.]|nr:glycosyltransferase family protein [Archangium sp.]MDP3575835.1 glycosyltransferase family protein [Archangium sp.]
MRVVTIIQARISSTRLPAKVLLDLGGKTALERCLRRAQQFTGVDEVVIATSESEYDEPIALLARRLGVPCYRGSELDVLARYFFAATETRADVIVRVTSDCPLLDPTISSQVISHFLGRGDTIQYASNTLNRRLPRGLDTEVFSFEALQRANYEATAAPDREHVTRFIYTNAAKFVCESVLPPGAGDESQHRWTLDTPEDYQFLVRLFERLGSAAQTADLQQVLEAANAQPDIRKFNGHIEQKPT